MSLRLSKKYGVNPSILVCPVCGKDIGVALLGANGGKEAPRKITSMDLCDDCKQIVKEGNTFIFCVKQTKKGIQPTGAYIKVSNEYLAISIPPKGIAFMEESEFNKCFNNNKNEID